jgi:hypothetical protein
MVETRQRGNPVSAHLPSSVAVTLARQRLSSHAGAWELETITYSLSSSIPFFFNSDSKSLNLA